MRLDPGYYNDGPGLSALTTGPGRALSDAQLGHPADRDLRPEVGRHG